MCIMSNKSLGSSATGKPLLLITYFDTRPALASSSLEGHRDTWPSANALGCPGGDNQNTSGARRLARHKPRPPRLDAPALPAGRLQASRLRPMFPASGGRTVCRRSAGYSALAGTEPGESPREGGLVPRHGARAPEASGPVPLRAKALDRAALRRCLAPTRACPLSRGCVRLVPLATERLPQAFID